MPHTLLANDETARPRRAFLSHVAMLGAAAGLSDLAISARAAEAGGEPAQPEADFAGWLGSIHGKYRQVFDAPEPNEGASLIFPFVFLMTGPKAYGVPEHELGAVIVLRHHAIPMGFSDAVWARYKLGETFKIVDPATNAPSTRNFFNEPKPGDLKFPDAAIDRLMARGVKVGLCNVATLVFSGMAAKKMGLPPQQVYEDWVGGLLPGVSLVPSGVIAVHGAQAHGCTYCFAS